MNAISRRRFLQGAVAASAVGATVPRWMMPAGAQPLAADQGMVVVVTLTGGWDSLDVLVPLVGPRRVAYDLARGSIAVNPLKALPLNLDLGFSQYLPGLTTRYLAGDVAVIDGVGMPDNLRSHFVSEVVTQSASVQPTDTGWLGRHLDGYEDRGDELLSVMVGTAVPLVVRGSVNRCAALPPGLDLWGTDSTVRHEAAARDAVRAFADASVGMGPWTDPIAAMGAYALDKATLATGVSDPTSSVGLIRDLELAAHVLNADIGTRVVAVEMNGYDTHSGQNASLPALLGELDQAVSTFWSTLDAARHNRVMMLVVSEFGRMVHANASQGTDHGHAGLSLAIGPNVAGGLHGEHPDIAAPDEHDSLVPTTDLRAVYASVIDDWLAGDSAQSLGGSFGGLDLVAAAPGT